MAELLGRPLMPWQRLVSDVAGEIDARTGRFVYELVDLIVPRQAGKTTLALATLIQRCQVREMARCWYTSKTRQDAANLFAREWLPVIEASPLRPATRGRLATGSELLTFPRLGSTIGIFPPTRIGLHGWQGDTVFVDECWKFTLDLGIDIETGIRPAQITRRHAQLWRISAAGDDQSSYLDHIMDTGRELVRTGARSSRAYFEWSAPVDADDHYDIFDRDLWWAAHPALGFGEIDEAKIQAQAETMDAAEFARAYLCIPSKGSISRVISLEHWNAAIVDADPRPAPIAFAVDVSPDRSEASIAVAGRRADGRVQVEVTDWARGTAWLVGRLVELRQRYRARLVLDPAGPAGALRNDLSRNGLVFEEMTARSLGQACGAFYAGVVEGHICHIDQPSLNGALGGARRRPIGEAWAWDRKQARTDISPLVAVTLAHWSATQAVERKMPTPDIF